MKDLFQHLFRRKSDRLRALAWLAVIAVLTLWRVGVAVGWW